MKKIVVFLAPLNEGLIYQNSHLDESLRGIFMHRDVGSLNIPELGSKLYLQGVNKSMDLYFQYSGKKILHYLSSALNEIKRINNEV